MISGAHLYRLKTACSEWASFFPGSNILFDQRFRVDIAYGSYFGSKVSIYGEIAKYGAGDFQDELIYRNRPELIQLVLEMLTERYLRATYAWLFREPWESAPESGLGLVSGWSLQRIAPSEMAKVLFNRRARLRRLFSSAMRLVCGRS